MSTAKKIFSNTLWQFLAKFTVSILGLLVMKITTQYLSSGGDIGVYGQYSAVYEYIAYFGIIADLGLYTIAVKEMSKDEENITKIIGNVLSLRFILVTSAMLTAVSLIFFIPKYNYEGSYMVIGVAISALIVFLTIINGTITSVLQTKYKMGQASVGIVIGKIITVLYMLYVIFIGYPADTFTKTPANIETGFYLIIAAGALGAAITLLITYQYVKKITKIRMRFDMDIWRKVMVQALPYGIALILNTIYFRLDTFIIFMEHGEKELALYTPAMRLLEQFTILPLYFMNSVLPVLNKSLKDKNQKYKEIVKHAFDALAALALPLVVGGAVLSYPIIKLITTDDFLSKPGFHGSDIALKILIFAVLFQFLNVLFAFMLIAVDQQKKLLYINAICVAFNLITNIIFIPKYGFVAAAITSVLSEMLILAGTYIMAKKHIDFSISLKNLSKMLLSAIVMGIVVKLLAPSEYTNISIQVPALIMSGIITYSAMLWITKTVDKNTIKLLMKRG